MTRTIPMLPALALLTASALSAGCGSGSINLFTVDDDLELGAQLHEEISSDPEAYPIVDPADAPEAYDYLYALRDEILATGQVDYADEFAWEIYLIDDDETLNAFAAPGGYIYVYTGLIEFLDEPDYFAGVMGHEMAHAAERHSTEQLTKAYGIQELVGLVLGEDPGLVAEIAAGLVNLSFSRSDEAEADALSVEYLCETPEYAADGAAGFFEQLLADSGIELPEFLSTHPSSESRVADIRAYAGELGCSVELAGDDEAWAAFKASLP